MAYPTVSAPYGFKAVNRVDGMPYAGAIRQIPITTSYATALYYGDVVTIATGGTVEKASTSSGNITAANILGVFVGCSYTNSSGQPVQSQYYPGTSVTNPVAFVVDDPMAAYKVAVAYANGVVTTVTQAAVGTNMSYYNGTGSTATGDSGAFVLAASGANTATLPFRVISVVTDTATSNTTFVEVIVKINTDQYLTALGNNLS
jgi:hypothetical protein